MPAERKRFYKRWWFRILVVLAVAVVSFEIRERTEDAADLEAALAETDRQFPNDWRLEDVLAKMPPPTPADKDPLRILATWESAGVGRIYNERAAAAAERLAKLGPAVRPDPEQLALFRETLLTAKPHLDELEPFRATRDVYHPLDWKENYLEILLGHTQSMRSLTAFNSLRATIALEEEDEKEAVESFLAIHHSLSWLHRESTLISQLVRIACFNVEMNLLERMLAKRELSPESLRRFADLIDTETKVDPMRIGLMLEMGAMDRLAEAVLAGRVDFEHLVGGPGRSSGLLLGIWFRYYGKRNRATLLREMGIIRRALDQNASPRETLAFFRDFEQRLKRTRDEETSTYLFAGLLLPSLAKVYEAKVRFEAQGRVGVAALAFERYRLDHQTWPTGWNDLTPKYLASTPVDPWTDQPLKFKRNEKGVVIYSVGKDETDDNGKINRERLSEPGSDLGFELFDPQHRRQPAPPKPVGPGEKE
jgi:hypothetical protein